MSPGGMSGVGRRFASQHRQLASKLRHGSMARLPSGKAMEVTRTVLGTMRKPAPNGGMPTDMAIAGGNPRSLQHTLGTMRGLVVGFSTVSISGGNPNALQHKFGTMAGTTVGFSTVSNSGDDSGTTQAMGGVIHVRGNSEELRQRISIQIDETKTKVLGFEERYLKFFRSRLSSRCLIMPAGSSINDPWTAFLHRQILKISGKNPSYLSCFDVMAYDSVKRDEDEFERFLNHLVDRNIQVIENWDSSFSTIQILMYDFGLKEPDDGTNSPFYKGECDASYDPVTKTASLSYIIWKGLKIIYSEVFSSVECSSANEAEMFAACALLYKAEELEIDKLLICTDCKTVATILNGEQLISMSHKQRDFFLMLRAMRSRFKWLVATWKPRELMMFVDDLAKAAKSGSDSAESCISRFTTDKWADHLRGFPVFRVEWTPDTTTAVKQIGKVKLDDSYGKDGDSIYFVQVDEEMKLDCLVGLSQRLEPRELTVFVSNYDDKADSFKKEFETDYQLMRSYSPSGPHLLFIKKAINYALRTKRLVVSLDYTVPKHVYFRRGAFHVVLVTPSERKIMGDTIPELTAWSYVYFKGVRFPLNEPEK